jgi:tetratricopeptide (TPR) repeat protein
VHSRKTSTEGFASSPGSSARRLGLGRAQPSFFTAALCLGFGLAAACGGPPPIHDVPPPQLRDQIARDVPGLSRRSVVIPHEISDETFAHIHAKVDDLEDPSKGARALLQLLFDERYLDLDYIWGETRSAELTIAAGGGNCLSLAAVLVGAARKYSGAARYIEIQDRPEQRDEGDLEIWASHIAVLLPSIDGPLVVDFRGVRDEETRIRFQQLSDRELVAHYYNDKGYDLIRKAREQAKPMPWRAALGLFEIATQIDPDLSRAWNNVGVARARLGEFQAADDAYQRALNGRSDYLEEATADNLISLRFRRLDSREESDQ